MPFYINRIITNLNPKIVDMQYLYVMIAIVNYTIDSPKITKIISF